MRRPMTLPTLRFTTPISTALVLAVGLVTACGHEGGSAGTQTTEDPDTATGTTTSTVDESSTAEPTTAEPTTGNPTSTSDDPDPDTTSGTSGEPEPTLEEQLEGHWVSEGCEPAPQADGSTLYIGRDFVLGLGSWAIEGTIYGDDACSYPLLTFDLGGEFEVVGPAVGIEGAHEANFDRSSIALTPHVSNFVDWFNAEGCGESAWEIGVQQDVTENGCAFVPSATACPVEHDLVALEGSDRLFFGQRPLDGDMCSPRARPTALVEHAVVRQRG